MLSLLSTLPSLPFLDEDEDEVASEEGVEKFNIVAVGGIAPACTRS